MKNLSANVISEFTSNGVPVSSTGYTPSGFAANNVSAGIAFDSTSNLWVTTGNQSIMEVFGSGGSIGQLEGGPYKGGGQLNGTWLAVDSSGFIWTTKGNHTVSKFNNSGTSQLGASGSTVSNINQSSWLSFGASGNPWVVDNDGTGVAEVNASTGATITSDTSGVGGVSFAFTVQVDPAGSIWTANAGANSINQLSINGTTITGDSPSAGYIDPNLDTGVSMLSLPLDGSGNAWGVDSDSFLIQWIGIPAPQSMAVTPSTYATLP